MAAACILPWCAASLCPRGLQYWSNDSETCINCSQCDDTAKQVVIRPCQAHADTVCGHISDLNIDWSWLKNPAKHHNKKNPKHFENLGDDLSNYDAEGNRKEILFKEKDHESTPSEGKKHKGKKHHKQDPSMFSSGEELQDIRKHNFHHISSESLLSEDFEPTKEQRLSPPMSSSRDDLEKEWKKLLVQSKYRLQQEKEDLLKNLHQEESKPYFQKHHSNVRLNQPTSNLIDGPNTYSTHHNHQKHFSTLELELFDRLLSHQQERQTITHLLTGKGSRRSDERDLAEDLEFPTNYRSAVPTHRLFLGEPSTVSEIMEQDLSEEMEDERLAPDVIAVPFSAAETLVWDWQAIALSSAVAACLLFFTVVAVFTLLQARQLRRMKTYRGSGK